jgi:competence protein ComEA
VARLLTSTAAGGWVPAAPYEGPARPEPPAAPVPRGRHAAPPLDGEQPPDPPSGAGPLPAPLLVPAAADAPAAPPLVPAAEAPAAPLLPPAVAVRPTRLLAPADADEASAEDVRDPERSWSPRPATAPVVAGSSLLPDTLRGGRLDPGHRGAVALLLVCVLAAVVAGGAALRGRPEEVVVPAVEQAGEPLPGTSAEPEPEPTELVVSVAGDVVAPGLVRLPPGSRVDDAVRAAGGLAPGATYGLLNLARALVDGEQVLVGVDPPPGAEPAPGGGSATGSGGLLDLNAASASELESLPGIGPVLAERIVDWRTDQGRFKSVDQLREVPGIGEAKYAALKSKVTV